MVYSLHLQHAAPSVPILRVEREGGGAAECTPLHSETQNACRQMRCSHESKEEHEDRMHTSTANAPASPSWGQQTLLKCPKCNCIGNVTFLPSRSRPDDKKCTCGDCGYRWLFVKSDANANEAEGQAQNQTSKPLTSTSIEDVLEHLRATQHIRKAS